MQQRNNLKINNENENEKENEKKDEIAGKAKPKSFTVKWISKFIPINGKIILDRSFSESSKYNVLLKNNDAEDKNIFQFDNEDQSKKNQNGKDEKNLFVVSKWDYGNPNVLSVSTSDNKVRTDTLETNTMHLLFYDSLFSIYFFHVIFFYMYLPVSIQDFYLTYRLFNLSILTDLILE